MSDLSESFCSSCIVASFVASEGCVKSQIVSRVEWNTFMLPTISIDSTLWILDQAIGYRFNCVDLELDFDKDGTS